MNIIVFGATGIIGKQIVQQALFENIHVTAFGRNVFTTEFINSDNLILNPGALFDANQVYDAIKGNDVVIAVLDGKLDNLDKTISLGLKTIIAQMEKLKVKRLITLGNQGILNALDDTLLMNGENFPKQLLPVSIENLKILEILQKSDLDWTLLCAPNKVIDDGPTGIFVYEKNYIPNYISDSIKAGDIALFMLNEIRKNEFIRFKIGIGQKL